MISPLLSYQRMTGRGRPVALQDSVTSPPSITVMLAGGETITGLEPLPKGKKKTQRIHLTKEYDA